MKKLIFIFAFLVTPFLMYAQGVGLGLKGGVNFANVAAEDLSPSTITDFHVGAFLNLNFSDKFGITPELLWTGQGSKFDASKLNTKYVSIPVMLRFKPVSLLSLEVGPQFSFLTDAESDTYNDIKSQLKSNDFGMAAGAAVHLPFGLSGGIRYVLGFTDINEAKEDYAGNVKNKTFQIYVGWTLFGSK